MATLPLPALLSQFLVSLLIELDNEFEHQMPHRTTDHGGTRGAPWLTSWTMWANCLRFLEPQGIPIRELFLKARTRTNLRGMRGWRYINIVPDPSDSRPKPPKSAMLIRPAEGGLKAQGVWQHLLPAVEKRWHDRFGEEQIHHLRTNLQALVDHLDIDYFPDCLPIVGYGLWSRIEAPKKPLSPRPQHDGSLPSLLCRVLLAFANEFESGSPYSLAIASNVLRVLNETGVPRRDLPRLSGVSKESMSMALGVLQKMKLANTVQRLVVLTPHGVAARDSCSERIARIEKDWTERFGREKISALRVLLEHMLRQPLAEPYADCWRALVPQPETLPHYPMVTHRGGYPDGS